MSYNLNINSYINKEEISKYVFPTKQPEKDGLLLQVHHTNQKGKSRQVVRFIHFSFNKDGKILAACDHTGNIVLIDLERNKFWVLPIINPCTVLKFSLLNAAELIVGVQTGALYIINIETSDVIGELLFHKYPIVEITFSVSHICLSSSRKEAVIWDLRSHTKIQVLSLLEDCILKHVLFIPTNGDILACFDDNTILIWKCDTYEVCKEIRSNSLQLNSIKSISFTRNGRAMILAGYLPQLTIFTTDTWTVADTVTLPDYITSIKKISFIPQLFDGGSNKTLAILSGNGVLYFYDLENDEMISKIITDHEILKFDCSTDGKYVACLIHSGELNVYSGALHTTLKSSKTTTALKATPSRQISLHKKRMELKNVREQMGEYLAVNKLVAILKEFGEYPDSYRSKIWAQLLQLPNNKKQYNTFINHALATHFENLQLDNKSALLSLKKVLSNLITWCPHFAHVTYLPVFVFPFTRIFQNEPILCFEAVCTIILNWCQNWFEYFPLPPINILAMVENILVENDLELLDHLSRNDVTSKLYAWPLFEAAYSETVNRADWCKLWDHILSNEPAFFIVSIAAYNLYNRQVLLSMRKKNNFEHFYRNQNMFDLKKFISKTYTLMSSISTKNHPRQYLNSFQCLSSNSYPSFAGFPKKFIDFDFNEICKLENEQKQIANDKELMLTQRQILLKNLEIEERQRVEEQRLREVEAACRSKIVEETERVKEKRVRFNELRRQLQLEEMDLLNKSREKIIARNMKHREEALEHILGSVEQNRATEEIELARAEDDLVQHYSQLLHHKIKLEKTLQTEMPSPGLSNECRLLKVQQQKLAESLEVLKSGTEDNQQLKNITLATGISAMDDLILRVEMELAQQMADRYENVNKGYSTIKMLKLESETKQLELEVSKLLSVLADVKSQETRQRLHELHENVTERELERTQKNKAANLILSGDQKLLYAESFGKDFEKLKEMIEEVNIPIRDEENMNNISEQELAVFNFETD